MSTLLTRDQFREAVFKRDNHLCVFCKTHEAAAAHHIIERRLWPDGGYYIDNGASVCPACHLDCEETWKSVEEVRAAAGITKIIVPPQLYPDQKYDKWGNPILDNGQRTRGELFYDQSVQKVLKPFLHLFTNRFKYPRTYHLPWSPGLHDDDRMIESTSMFEGKYVVVTEKMDGENTTIYKDYLHARSVDGRNHPSRDWVKALQARLSSDLSEDMRICGENLRAEHSIRYERLDTYFLVFSIWIKDFCLSWYDTQEWCQLLNLQTVPVLYEGIYDEKKIRQLDNREWKTHEGYVIRNTDGYMYSAFRKNVAKFVRKGHVQTNKHWMQGSFTENSLAKPNHK